MKIQQTFSQVKHSITALPLELIVLCILLVSPLLLSQAASAQTKVTADSYCAKYTDATEKNACNDGWKATDCTFYLQSHGQNATGEKLVSICQEGSRAKDNASNSTDGDSTNGNATDNPKTDDKPSTGSGNTNSSNSGETDTLQQLIDQVRELQEITGTGTKDPNKVPDNNYGQYVNGRGDLQPLRVKKASGENSPAIIFVNGGGWHTDDGVGDKIAPKAVERGYSTFVATYRLGSSGIYYMLDDITRAIRHVRNNAGMYGIDPNRIAVFGDSAGASLAMRAVTSGKTGVAAAVGWSTPTNAYTVIFRSPQTFAVAMDHSTCVPTDLNGVANILDQLNGGEGDLPDDGGLGNNGLAGSDTALGTVNQVLTLAQTAQNAGKSAQSIAEQLEQSSGSSGSSSSSGSTSSSDSDSSDSTGELEQNVRRLTAKKLIQCIDNFNSASPALFASPLSPPTFLAGFEHDPYMGADQAYQLRDKLRSMGVPSSTLILPGVPGPLQPGENHLDYNEAFVAPSLDFLDKFLHPPNAPQ